MQPTAAEGTTKEGIDIVIPPSAVISREIGSKKAKLSAEIEGTLVTPVRPSLKVKDYLFSGAF